MMRAPPCGAQAGGLGRFESGAWRSLVAPHLLWEQRVGGSNPSAPISGPPRAAWISAAGLIFVVDPHPAVWQLIQLNRPDQLAQDRPRSGRLRGRAVQPVLELSPVLGGSLRQQGDDVRGVLEGSRRHDQQFAPLGRLAGDGRLELQPRRAAEPARASTPSPSSAPEPVRAAAGGSVEQWRPPMLRN